MTKLPPPPPLSAPKKGDPPVARELRTRALADIALEWLREDVLPKLQPLSEEDYAAGPLAILHTAARFCYVLATTAEDGDDASVKETTDHDGAGGGQAKEGESHLLWCIDWAPGVLVVRVDCSSGQLAFAAVRRPSVVDPARWEDIPDPAYALIYDAWDAEVGDLRPQERAEWQAPAAAAVALYESGLAQLQAITNRQLPWAAQLQGEELKERKLAWLETCRQSPIFCGALVM